MANKALKGLTIQIGADTSDLLDSLKDIEKQGSDLSKELGQINKLLKLDPDNAELVAQKQKVLAGAVSNTEAKLEKLKDAEQQAQEQFKKGEISEAQYRALQREIIATEKKLGGYEQAVKETARAEKKHGDEAEEAAKDVDKLADSSKDAEKSSEGLGGALAGAAKAGLAAVGAAVGAVVGGLTAAAESTREYRTEMGKLNTAFESSGSNAEVAQETYMDLVSVLGDTGQAVEAANHLAKLTTDTEDLQKWTDIATGVYATFGASLPIEGLTEAANETAKVGQLTGSLADALNWAGVNEEEFQASLDACSSEQERQQLITKTLSGLYGEAAEAYRENNAEVIRANDANEAWMYSLSQIGGSIEPIITDVKRMGASLLTELVPGVQSVADAFRGILGGEDGAAEELGGALSGLITDVLNKIIEIAPTIVQVGMSLITTLATTLINSLPMMVDTAIQLVGSIIEGLTIAIPQIVQALTDMLPKLVDALVEGIPMLIDGAVQLLLAITEAIPVLINALVPQLPRIIMSIVNGLLDNVDELLNGAIDLLMAIVQAIPVIIKMLVPLIPQIVQKIVRTLVANLPVLLKGAVELFMALVQAIPEINRELRKVMPQVIGAIVKGLGEGIQDIADVGGDLIRGLWNGIKDMTSWITDKLAGFGDTVLSGIKDFFGIASPSKVLAKEVGRFLPAGLAKGITDNASLAVDAMSDLSDDMMSEAEQMNGVTLERRLHNTFDPVPRAETVATGLLGKLDSILAAIERGQILTIDGDTLVGATANMMDSALGRRRTLAARGAI